MPEYSDARFERIEMDSVDEDELNAYQDRIVFQTFAWVRYIAHRQGAEPILAELRSDGEVLGFVTGLVVDKFGFRIFGSPFRRWNTLYMGFNLRHGVPRSVAIEALAKFAFTDLKCHHVELADRYSDEADYPDGSYDFAPIDGYEIDLTLSEEQLLENMASMYRKYIRKAANRGVVIEEASDLGFAEDYYDQIMGVMGPKGVHPGYELDDLKDMIRFLHPKGYLLLLRARLKDGTCAATGIFPGMNKTMYGWGLASWHHLTKDRPNEALIWHAMKTWKGRGIEKYDMFRRVPYKEYFGPQHISVPWSRKSKNMVVSGIWHLARLASRARRNLPMELARIGERLRKTSR